MDDNFRLHEEIDDLGKARKRGIKFLVIFMVVLVLFSFGTTLLQIYTDWLWFKFDAQQELVFQKKISSQIVLWLIGLSVAFVAIFVNARAALKSDSVFDTIPADENARAAANVLSALQKFGRLLALGVAMVVGLGVASSLSNAYRQYWAFTAASPFGQADPLFDLDLSFFVFKLPWYMTIFDTLLWVLVVTLAVTLAGYLGTKALAGVAKVQLAQGPMRVHVSLLAGLTIIVFGARMIMSRYLFGIQEGLQFTGPGYAQSQVIKFYVFIGAATILVGVLTMLNAKLWKPWRAPAFGLASVLIVGLLLLRAYPGLVQKFQVDPNLLVKEPPFAERAIESTRFAYGLDKFKVREFDVQNEPTAEEIAVSQSTLRAMRLWDPNVLKRVLKERQSLRPYYDFFDVDIDRYMVDGEQRMVMLAPRDISYEGVADRSRNWQNEHLRYTHGFGLVMVPANESVLTGQPNYWISNFPPGQGDKFDIEEQRIYFSHYPTSSPERNGYLLLQSDLKEFDYPAGTDQVHTWAGSRGIPISPMFTKFVFSLILSEFRLYTSNDITADTKIIYRRDILDRASLVYPFLEFDRDPYIVLEDGRIQWIIDAYTVSDSVPYSELLNTPQGTLNYMRNSVKIVIDAYSGEMKAYAIDEEEPILKTWMKVFPDLIHPNSEVPDNIRAHFRYAEGLFDVQAEILKQYHVTDPVKFLSNEDAWQISRSGSVGSASQISPYFVTMRLPDGDVDEFMLILPFSPRGKNNMIGWMAAHCDPESYGKVELYSFPKDTQTQGPGQMEASFDQDPIVADINRQFNNDQTDIVPGNLLVIPVGSSLLYVKPLFLQSKARPIPELRKVLLGLQNRVVVADTYVEALDMLFGQSMQVVAAEPTDVGEDTESPKPVPSGTAAPPPEVAEALRLMDLAEAALKRGDIARYAELNRQAREKLRGVKQ